MSTALRLIALAAALGLGLTLWHGLSQVGMEQRGQERLRRLEARVQALEERWLLDQYLREAPLAGPQAREGRK